MEKSQDCKSLQKGRMVKYVLDVLHKQYMFSFVMFNEFLLKKKSKENPADSPLS